MKLRRVSAKVAAAIDEALMGNRGFTIDQLMELAGIAVSQAVYKLHNPLKGARVLILVGPGNNGGDGLVASRHLKLLGYKPIIYCPKLGDGVVFQGLHKQLETMNIEYTEDIEKSIEAADFIVDSLFGFSFKPPVRRLFAPVMDHMSTTRKPILSVDVPSGWDVDTGPNGCKFVPDALISLTAPKECTRWFTGRHFVGGRFVDQAFAHQFEFDVPPYEGLEHIYEL